MGEGIKVLEILREVGWQVAEGAMVLGTHTRSWRKRRTVYGSKKGCFKGIV